MGGYGVYNGGALNSERTVTGTGGIGGHGGDNYASGAGGGGGYGGLGGSGVYNGGTLNNERTVTGTGGIGGHGGDNYASGLGGGGGGWGGDGGVGVYDDNGGITNNEGTVTGWSSPGGPGGTSSGHPGNWNYEITNWGTINDYCGVTISLTDYNGNSPHAVFCSPVTFYQSGIPTVGVAWGVTVSWGPFVLPEDYGGTGGSIAISATGSLNYSYDSPMTGPRMTWVCQSGCSGTTNVTGATTFTAAYRIAASSIPLVAHMLDRLAWAKAHNNIALANQIQNWLSRASR
jgi:hypothetical protein